MEARSSRGGRELAPGEVFGRYTIVRRLGEGGMATVYEALNNALHKRVALKTMHPWFAMRVDVMQRFVIEARAASRLAHPHAVAVHELGIERHMPFMAMDLLEGEDLFDLIDREGRLPVERAADILLPIASALAAAHDAGILHRDVKPENIFLARRPPRGEHPVLLDFGISKFDHGSPVKALTAEGEVIGTPEFMSPEQADFGMDRFDARSDQYAFGVMLYLCVTGALPYAGESVPALLAAITRGGAPPPSAREPSVPAAFDELVMRAMAPSPGDRFPSMRALGRALLQFAGPVARSVWSADLAATEPSAGAEVRPSGAPTPRDLRVVHALEDAWDADLERAAEIARHARVAGGMSVFVQGTRGTSCFLLLSGDVEILKTIGAETWEMGRLGPGALLGLAALWDDAPRPVSAVATTDCVVLELQREALPRLEAECPAIVDRLLDEAIGQAADRLRHAGRRGDPPSAPSGRAEDDVDRDALAGLAAALREWSLASPNAPLSEDPGIPGSSDFTPARPRARGPRSG